MIRERGAVAQRISSGIALREDGLFPGKQHNFSALADGCEECLRIEIVPRPGRNR
jgi:hypothetical protein